MTMMVTANDTDFQYQAKVPHDSRLVQIGWFQFKYVMRYRADEVKFTDIYSKPILAFMKWTDRQTERQLPATKKNPRPERT